MNWTNLLLSTEGRIDRTRFVIGLLPVLALIALVYVYGGYVKGSLPAIDWLVMGAISLEALYFLTCLGAKRLRDIARPQWFLVILYSPLAVAAVFLVQQKFLPLKTHELSVTVYTAAIMLALIGFLWILAELLFRRTVASA